MSNIWADDLPESYSDLSQLVVDVLGSKAEEAFSDTELKSMKKFLERELGGDVDFEYTYHYTLTQLVKESAAVLLENSDEWENFFNNSLLSGDRQSDLEVFVKIALNTIGVEYFNDNEEIANAIADYDADKPIVEFLKKITSDNESEQDIAILSQTCAEVMRELHKQHGKDVALSNRYGESYITDYFNFVDSHIYCFEEAFLHKEDLRTLVADHALSIGASGNISPRFGMDVFLPALVDKLSLELSLSQTIEASASEPQKPTNKM